LRLHRPQHRCQLISSDVDVDDLDGACKAGVTEGAKQGEEQKSSIDSSSSSKGDAVTVNGLLMIAASCHQSMMDVRISELKKEREAFQLQKKKVAKELRLTLRRRQRLKTRARTLSSQDLVEVLQYRKKDLLDRETKKK
jgi:hypothetical protein